MPAGPQFGFGAQRLFDARQRFVRGGQPVYYRIKNFPDTQGQNYSDLGFIIAPSGTITGTTDILITPQPDVTYVSMHNIGQSNGTLRIGARYFVVSASFVNAQMAAQSVTDANMIWRGPQFLGLVTEGLLFSVVTYEHKDVSGSEVLWWLTCNANEIR